jgi:hypothetical protein
MTVKELKEKLNQFPDDLIVMIPNIDWDPYKNKPRDVVVKCVTRGVNEADGCVFLDDYDKDE